MYFNSNIGLWPVYTPAIYFLAAQNPKSVGLFGEYAAFYYPVWVLLKDRLNTMPRVEYVGVRNASRKLREQGYAPPFILSVQGPSSTLEVEDYHVVEKFPPVTVLATAKAADKVLEPWRKIINIKNLLIRSHLEVYLDRNQNRLVYVKDRCQPAVVGSVPSHQLLAKRLIFLHVIPADVEDLPDYRKRYEFENLDFSFNDHRLAIRLGERCLAVRDLPAYAVVGIRTGEHTDEGRLWGAEVSFNE